MIHMKNLIVLLISIVVSGTCATLNAAENPGNMFKFGTQWVYDSLENHTSGRTRIPIQWVGVSDGPGLTHENGGYTWEYWGTEYLRLFHTQVLECMPDEIFYDECIMCFYTENDKVYVYHEDKRSPDSERPLSEGCLYYDFSLKPGESTIVEENLIRSPEVIKTNHEKVAECLY